MDEKFRPIAIISSLFLRVDHFIQNIAPHVQNKAETTAQIFLYQETPHGKTV
jgi:hypothetical protein